MKFSGMVSIGKLNRVLETCLLSWISTNVIFVQDTNYLYLRNKIQLQWKRQYYAWYFLYELKFSVSMSGISHATLIKTIIREIFTTSQLLTKVPELLKKATNKCFHWLLISMEIDDKQWTEKLGLRRILKSKNTPQKGKFARNFPTDNYYDIKNYSQIKMLLHVHWLTFLQLTLQIWFPRSKKQLLFWIWQTYNVIRKLLRVV